MPGRLLSSFLNLDTWENGDSFDSHAWQRHHAPIFEPGFLLRPKTSSQMHSHWHDFVSFKKKKKGNDHMNMLVSCVGPLRSWFSMSHGRAHRQIEVLHDGHRICQSELAHDAETVKYPPDTGYQRCLKQKEEDPEKKCKPQILKDLKIKGGGWFVTGGEDHPIAWKVKGIAKDAGIRRGYELIAIDGNQADWREQGYKAYIKSLNWNAPPPNGPYECEPGDSCKPAACPPPPPPPPPPLPPAPLPPATLPGKKGHRFPMAFQAIEAPVGPTAAPTAGPTAAPTGPANPADPSAPAAPETEVPEGPPLPCYPNGHSLTFKVTAPAWMFWAGPKTTCKPFRETCCTEASTRLGLVVPPNSTILGRMKDNTGMMIRRSQKISLRRVVLARRCANRKKLVIKWREGPAFASTR
eukprot:s2167_g6.t1